MKREKKQKTREKENLDEAVSIWFWFLREVSPTVLLFLADRLPELYEVSSARKNKSSEKGGGMVGVQDCGLKHLGLTLVNKSPQNLHWTRNPRWTPDPLLCRYQMHKWSFDDRLNVPIIWKVQTCAFKAEFIERRQLVLNRTPCWRILQQHHWARLFVWLKSFTHFQSHIGNRYSSALLTSLSLHFWCEWHHLYLCFGN